MTHTVVSVATTDYTCRGQARLQNKLAEMQERNTFWQRLPPMCPTHAERPYAFKAYALKTAAAMSYDLLLWADACMLPVRPLDPLWKRIERDGYWFSANGFSNYEWTADSAYPDLFAAEWKQALDGNKHMTADRIMEDLRALNRNIPHVVAGCFGLSMRHEIGREFLKEYYRLASETKAFCGPWINQHYAASVGMDHSSPRVAPCGPSDVKGHRHDQTAASVIAHRLGMVLTNPPDLFAYGREGDTFDERTVVIADGSYK